MNYGVKLLLIGLLFSLPAQASELLNPTGRSLLNEEHAHYETTDLDMRKKYCDFVNKNSEKGEFLDPEYQNHLPDVPAANIQGEQQVVMLDEYEFELTLDLADRAGIDLPDGLEAKDHLGTIRYSKEGVFLGDYKLSQEDEASLENLCKSETN